MLTRLVAVTAGFLALLAAPALAQPEQTQRQVGDPNEKVCENITPIGSRLATKRFCGTRAEWADRKRQDREALERAQLSPCVMTHSVRGANGNGHQAC